MHAGVHICIFAGMFVSLYVRMHTCMNACMYVLVCKHYMQCGAVCCSASLCVAVNAVCYSVLHTPLLHSTARPGRSLQCVAACCTHHLKCVAVCCSVLQCLAVCSTRHYSTQQHDRFSSRTHTQICNVKSHTCQSAVLHCAHMRQIINCMRVRMHLRTRRWQ